MKKIIHFIGNLLIAFANIISFTRNLLLLTLLVGICLGVLMLTLLTTFQVLTPEQNLMYPEQIIVFKHEIWAWIVGGLGWVTMGYGVKKLFDDDKKNSKKEYTY